MTATLTPATQTPAPKGSLIVTTGTSLSLDWWRAHEYREGVTAIVEDYVNAEESSDGHAFYWASNNGGVNNLVIAAEHVRLVKTPEEVAEARTPTLTALKEYVGNALLSDGDGFDITATGRSEGADTVAVYGRTKDGLPFGVHVTVGEPFETDF